MDRVFLDANVLFSAAYRSDSRLVQLWSVEGVQLVSSPHAMEEARRNLPSIGQRERLVELVKSLEVSTAVAEWASTADIVLPDKDRPILLGAIGAKATHLLTGDVTHFGRYLGKTVHGVLILQPAEYFRRKGFGRANVR